MAEINAIKVDIAVLLGATDMPLGQVLEISRGAMIALERDEHQPSLLMVNGHLVARGHVTVRHDRLALTITEMTGAAL